jgi:hypothetical protein
VALIEEDDLKRNICHIALSLIAVAGSAEAVPVDLSTWTVAGTGTWNLSADHNSVTQTVNGNPTVFFGPGNAQGNQLSGTIRVPTSSDNDFIGFVLGFESGDLTAPVTDFLLIDWKQGNQASFGCTALSGLAISRVTSGLGNDAGAWCHAAANGVTELARGSSLGSTGWLENVTYDFDLVFTATNVQVFVNNVKEIDISGIFANGGFGFYNYSQSNVTYGAIQQDVIIPTTPVPEPASLMLLTIGLAGVVSSRRRLRKA